MDDNYIYLVSDIEGFCESVRKFIAEDLQGKPVSEKLNLDEFITIKQIEKILIENCYDYDEDGNVYIDENSYEEICEQISLQVYGSALSKLGAANKIEIMFDSEINDFTFSLKEE